MLEGAPLAEAAARFGYSPSALASLVRDFRAGKLALLAEPGRPPGSKSAPKKNAARSRVIELRRQGLSVYEIAARLAAEGTPLNRTGVGQILAEEGFGRLLRHPASLRPASARPRPGGPRTCPPPGSSTSPPSPPPPAPGSPGCCWPSPTWSPSTCPPWPAKPATPARKSSPPSPGCCPCWPSSSPPPGASATPATCPAIPPAPCSPGWRSCRRSPRSPAVSLRPPALPAAAAPRWPPPSAANAARPAASLATRVAYPDCQHDVAVAGE